MIKICHRINTIESLQQTSSSFGVEMDLHAYNQRLIVHHDPFEEGVDFEDWLDNYQHSFIILNIKEEGIEFRVRELVLARGITDFFMLDLSFPALIKMVKIGEKRTALRVSCYESVETAFAMKGMAEWIWLDLFTDKFPLSAEQYHQLKSLGYRVCLVSPELHGRNDSSISLLQSHIKNHDIIIDAVCTKFPEKW